jgi:hypothetical protein
MEARRYQSGFNIKAVLDDINQKYGHIDPLFTISDNP